MKKSLLLLVGGALLFSADNYPNQYSCGLFPTPLNSYSQLQINGKNIDACGTGAISAATYNDSNQELQCAVDNQCSALNKCVQKNPPLNKYSHTILESSKTEDIQGDNGFYELDKTDYKDYNFNEGGITIHFNPQESYNDNDIKYMKLGNYTFSGEGVDKLEFEPGDYYFESLNFNSDVEITLPHGGPVRIFVKNDTNFNRNVSINKEGSSHNLLIYVGGNLNLQNGGDIRGYIYGKRDININNNNSSNDFDLYGGITAEGNIQVGQDNANFYYEGEPEELGYGECPLCYALSDGGHLISFKDYINGEFSFPRIMAIINDSNETLYNLKASQIEDTSEFSSNRACYYVVDKNGNKVDKDISIRVNGLGGSIFNCVYTLGDTNVTADFGNYPATGTSDYLGIETTGISGQFLGNEKLKYYATYVDENGRKYSVQIGYCQDIHSNKTYETGPFDAWDVFRVVIDRNISTKIVNKRFSIKLGVFENNWKDVSQGVADCEYRLYDADNDTNITDWRYAEFNVDSASAFPIANFTIDKAYKNVRVNFKFCQQKNPITGKIKIVPLAVCRENQPGSEYNTSTYSSDEFAIRPDKFEISVNNSSPIKAGDSFNIDFSALKYDSNDGAKEYNESVGKSFEIDVVENKDGCRVGEFNRDIKTNWSFADGNKTLSTSYSEVGDINITIKEVDKCKDRFAAVDCDDRDIPHFWNKDKDLPIKENTVTVEFVPHHFSVSSNLENYKGGNYTYLSKDLNMSAVIDLNVSVENKNNEVTRNYDKACYANDVNISISKSLTPSPKTLNNVLYVYNVNDTNSSEENVSISNDVTINDFSKDNFVNGSALLNVYVNFDRNSSKVEDKFTMKLSSVSAKDKNTNDSTSSINGEADFLYGRIHVHDASEVGNEVNSSFEYEYWNGSEGWVVNKNHTEEQGKVYFDKSYADSVLLKDSAIDYSADKISNGVEKVKFTTNHALPYGAKLHFSVSNWLWYHPLAKDYKDPSKDNLDCLTHPCMKVEFLDVSQGWGGISGGNKAIKEEFNATKRTTNIKASNDRNLSKRDVKKLNW
jgi:hypothetical protein